MISGPSILEETAVRKEQRTLSQQVKGDHHGRSIMKNKRMRMKVGALL